MEQLESTKRNKKKIIIIAVAAVLAVGLAVAAIFIFACGKPLSEAIAGRWEYDVDDLSLLTASLESVLGDEDYDAFNEIVNGKVSFKESFNFSENGYFSITVDKGRFIAVQNQFIDILIDYYSDNMDAFCEKSGFSRAELERVGITESNFKEFISSLFEDTRNTIAEKTLELESDENGGIIMFLGSYTVDGDKVSITSSDGKEYELTMRATKDTLKVKTSTLDIVSGIEGKVLTKTED